MGNNVLSDFPRAMQVGDVQTKEERRLAADARWQAHVLWRAVNFQHRPCPPAVVAPLSEPDGKEVVIIQQVPSSYFLEKARRCPPIPPDPAEELGLQGVGGPAADEAVEDAGIASADAERLARRQAELQRWNPVLDPKAVGVPSCTAFVARLASTVTDEVLRTFGEAFGRVLKTRVVRTLQGVSRRYGFIVFSLPREMQRAVADGNGQLLNGRRVFVDVERGRLSVSSFRPKRLRGIEALKEPEARVAPAMRPAQAADDEEDPEADLLDDILAFNGSA